MYFLPSQSTPPQNMLIVRKSDAKHNRHQKDAFSVVPGDHAPYKLPAPPPPIPTSIGDLPNIIDMNNTYKSHPQKGRQFRRSDARHSRHQRMLLQLCVVIRPIYSKRFESIKFSVLELLEIVIL